MREHTVETRTLELALSWHRAGILAGVAGAVILMAALTAFGWDYYILPLDQRPFSWKHAYLKPSGAVGLRLGTLGALLFLLIYLYPLRKRWKALGRIGKTKNWLDYHVLLGLMAPVVISFHSSFKVHGVAGLAYWTMIGLTASGIIGRYFYAQIPRSLSAAELSLKEMETLSAELTEEIRTRRRLTGRKLDRLFRLPESGRVQSMPLIWALLQMLWLDLSRPVKVWALRRDGTDVLGKLTTLGGTLRTRDRELESAISLASQQSALSKRILFLSKTHRVFHLWHVIHRPFSFSFAVFITIHISVVLWLGYW